ncbi:MAG: succinate dehydrogenase, hydrophobic membrane anchor protein [Pseudomonadota bacterium]
MSLINNGITQWKFQRVANVTCIIAAVALVAMLWCGSITSHDELRALFAPIWIKLFFAIALIIACINSVLAGWQIAADYAGKINVSEKTLVIIVAVVSIVYALYGLKLIF